MSKCIGKRSVAGFLCLCSLLVLTLGLPGSAVAADTIKIGHIDVLSGPFEHYGRVYHAATQFAVDEQNKKGGLLGKQIELLVYDNEFKPDVSTRKAKQAILEDKVDFIGGGSGSHTLMALGKVATAYKTILINYGGMSDIVQGKEFNRYAFRVCQNSYNFTAALAQLAANHPYRKFYIVCQDYAWGYDVAKAFKQQLKIHLPDAEIIGEDYHPLATKDFAPYINKVIASGADAVFSGNFGADIRLLIKQGRSLGLKQPFPFLTTFGVDPQVGQELGDDSIGILYAYDYSLRVDTPENKAMIERYREDHKDDPNLVTKWPWGALGHTILGWQMVFAAVEKAGTVEPEKFIETFEGFWHKTAVGWWQMRKCDHQVILPMFGGVVQKENPYWDFPWLEPNLMRTPAQESAIPPTSDYNSRCP